MSPALCTALPNVQAASLVQPMGDKSTAAEAIRLPSLASASHPNGPVSAAADKAAVNDARVDWSRVRLGVDAAPTMFVAHWSPEARRWDGGDLIPYGPLSLLPAAQVLNYGQSIFEGLKAYRYDDGSDGGNGDVAGNQRILLFRPDANATRFEAGAGRMCMPPVPQPMFLAAVQAVVRANAAWVPPATRGSLYLRPLLLGTGPLLGLCPAPSYTFVVYAVPVGGRAKEGRLMALDYLIHHSRHRAAPRGVGSTKAAGNYSPCLLAQAEARAQGCHDCIFLDAKSDNFLEEGSGCNVFTIHSSVITTPPAAGSILPGITRASLLQLAEALGFGVREAAISWKDALRADEMFASGTAVVVQPVGSVTFKGHRAEFCRSADAKAHDAVIGEHGANGNGYTNGHTDKGCTIEDGNSTSSSSNKTSTSSGECSEEEDAERLEEASGAMAGSDSTDATPTAATAFGGGTEDSPLCGFKGKTAAELRPEEREALAAFVPVPEPKALAPGVGPITHRLYHLLTGIQYGRVPDLFGWMLEVDMQGPKEGPLHLDELLSDQTEDSTAVLELEAGHRKVVGQMLSRPVFADPNLE